MHFRYECEVNSDLCGVCGDCVNVPNGGFYSCDCDDGFESYGDPSEWELICVGK